VNLTAGSLSLHDSQSHYAITGS